MWDAHTHSERRPAMTRLRTQVILGASPALCYWAYLAIPLQIMTAAADHSVLVWDTRAPKASEHQKKASDISANLQAAAFKHLDLTWKPLMKVHLSKSEPGGDHNPTLFSISEIQGDRR